MSLSMTTTIGIAGNAVNWNNGNLISDNVANEDSGNSFIELPLTGTTAAAMCVTPRPDEVHSTCNCKGAYVHQVPL